MREIKIRIFDTDSNKMLGDLLTFKDGGIVFVGDLANELIYAVNEWNKFYPDN